MSAAIEHPRPFELTDEVRLLGRDPHTSHAELTQVRRGLGYLPQELGYPGDMTVFGFVEAALLRPLPYAEPDRLVDVTETTPQIPRANLSLK